MGRPRQGRQDVVLQVDRRLPRLHLGEDPPHPAEVGVERPCLRILGYQLPGGGAFVRRGGAVDVAVDQLDLLLLKHSHPLGSRSASLKRSREVKRRDLTVLTGTSSTSAISS